MKEEIWLPVPGYLGLYSVSNLGNVMSMNYANTGMLKLLTPSRNSIGYWRVSLFKDGKQKNPNIHVLVMRAFVGPRPSGFHINHKNAIKKDNRLCNLEYCTAAQNKAHAQAMGLCAHGESNGGAKLTAFEVIDIKKKLTSGMQGASIAREYGVSKTAISRIGLGKTWKYLNGATLFAEGEG